MNKKILIASSIKKYSITVNGTNYEISHKKAKKGELITITVTPPEYRFTNISSDQVSINNIETNKYTFIMPAKNVIVNISYEESELHTITLNGNGTTGTISANKTTARWGETITITAIPAEYCSLESITSSDISLSGTGNTRTFIMPNKNVTITVIFKDPRPEPGYIKVILTVGYYDYDEGSDESGYVSYAWIGYSLNDPTIGNINPKISDLKYVDFYYDDNKGTGINWKSYWNFECSYKYMYIETSSGTFSEKYVAGFNYKTPFTLNDRGKQYTIWVKKS